MTAFQGAVDATFAKTATAVEFARWYAATGGVRGPVLFSSFEHHLPLSRLLDKIGEVFGAALRENGINWDSITDVAKRRQVALQVLQQTPVLWIWDNVEPVSGFPVGTESDWSLREQQELRAFLSAARETKAKFLLTSRRDERTWLSGLARRVQVPPMPMQERLQIAGAIAERRGKRLVDLPDLRPLLRFSRGNPLTILVTVGEVLRAGIRTSQSLAALEADFEDEATEGRTKSLGASLAYGFHHAFAEDESAPVRSWATAATASIGSRSSTRPAAKPRSPDLRSGVHRARDLAQRYLLHLR